MLQELEIETRFKDVKVRFDPGTGRDVSIQAVFCYGIKLLDDMNYIVYDEMVIKTEFDFEISQEVILANFHSLTVHAAGDYREEPIFTTLEFT
jgi:hypothetical protein